MHAWLASQAQHARQGAKKAMEKVSATIIVLNEETNIRDCLESVGWADEIIVSDTGSTDKTVELCQSFGARVYKDQWRGVRGPEEPLRREGR